MAGSFQGRGGRTVGGVDRRAISENDLKGEAAMSLFTAKGFDAFVKALPGTSFVDQWGSHVAKVGDKVFTLLGEGEDTHVVAKCTEESFEILTALEGINQAPYFARRKWVEIHATAPLSQEELAHYLTRSYELVAAGLTKKLRQELGITLPVK
jgi:predicted DNA-binding protein (MmcQ/YjbR family)